MSARSHYTPDMSLLARNVGDTKHSREQDFSKAILIGNGVHMGLVSDRQGCERRSLKVFMGGSILCDLCDFQCKTTVSSGEDE
jgi:hypothetical protein